ncbi:MAG: hypothetical protein M3Y85_11685 [Bacteroidota bacterium]|nr:hypothetical protein [Bacteroidota bacterium]
MKKILVLSICAICLSFATKAQTTTHAKTKVERTTKVKHTKSLKDRVHNTLHPRNKHYSGVKVKKEVKKED